VIKFFKLIWSSCQEVYPTDILLRNRNSNHSLWTKVGKHRKNNKRHYYVYEWLSTNSFFSIQSSLLKFVLQILFEFFFFWGLLCWREWNWHTTSHFFRLIVVNLGRCNLLSILLNLISQFVHFMGDVYSHKNVNQENIMWYNSIENSDLALLTKVLVWKSH
jgi:hypothetical protein